VPQHFLWRLENEVGCGDAESTERKNPLTFDSYAELCDLFRGLVRDSRSEVARPLPGGRREFLLGRDVHEIIGPLTRMGSGRAL